MGCIPSHMRGILPPWWGTSPYGGIFPYGGIPPIRGYTTLWGYTLTFEGNAASACGMQRIEWLVLFTIHRWEVYLT